MFGKSFTIITDHRALLSIMKEHRSNKSYISRLSRWEDRLLPFDFVIDYVQAQKWDWEVTFLANEIKKKKLQTNMMRKLRLRQLPAFVTQLQHFI